MSEPQGVPTMARVLFPDGGIWYDELKAVGYYGESDLERFILQHVTSLFPSFYVFPFKKDVPHRTTGRSKRPDLAMIRRDFKKWGIIEIELAHHNLAHVLDQTECFANGTYNGREVALYVKEQLRKYCQKIAGFDRLRTLIASELPNILVIADADDATWQTSLKNVPADLCVFEIFRSSRGHYLYRTFGGYPTVPVREAQCRRASLPNLLEIVGRFEFKGRRRQVTVYHDSTVTRWAWFDDAGTRFLRFLGSANPLSPNTTYRLFADSLDRYYLAPI
jgi:hypothetical protein